jgi:hypothetical protein
MDTLTKKVRKNYNRNIPKQADYDIHKRLLELKVLQGFLQSESQKDKQIMFMFQIQSIENEIRNIIGVQELGR